MCALWFPFGKPTSRACAVEAGLTGYWLSERLECD